jgi:hypothetical protein
MEKALSQVLCLLIILTGPPKVAIYRFPVLTQQKTNKELIFVLTFLNVLNERPLGREESLMCSPISVWFSYPIIGSSDSEELKLNPTMANPNLRIISHFNALINA